MANSSQYEHKIRDFHDVDQAFQFAKASSDKNSQELLGCIKELVRNLKEDLTRTGTERDRRSLNRVDKIFSNEIKEILSKIGGVSTIFDKIKAVVVQEISEGEISESEKQKILDSAQKQILKSLEEYRKQKTTEGSKENRKTTTLTPSITELNAFAKHILNNEKLVKRISDRLKGTIYGQCHQQSNSIINLLTHNKYKELALKIKKDNIQSVSTLNGTQTKPSVFGTIKKFKETRIGQIFNYKNLLKHFNIRRQKLNKKGFIGLYNEYVYKELMRRIDEFTNVVNFKGRMGKAILKGLLKWGGGMILSGITATLGFGWRMLKSAWGQVVKITKAVGKLGASIFKNLRQFLFTKTGMWIVGFFSGVIYKAVLEPLIQKFKAWFDILINPIREWLGIGEDEKLTIELIRNRISTKILKNIETKLDNGYYVNALDNIEKIENALDYGEDILRRIEVLVNGGGWKSQVGQMAGSIVGSLGGLIGSCFGPWGAILGGAIGGFAESAINYFVDRLPKTDAEKNVIINEITKMRDEFYRNDDNGMMNYKSNAIDNIEARILKLKQSMNDRKDGETEEQRNERIVKTKTQIKELREKQKRLEKVEVYGGEESEQEKSEKKKVKEISDKLKDEVNYFDFDRVRDWTSFDNQCMKKFWDNAQNGKYIEIDNNRKDAIFRDKIDAERTAMAVSTKQNIAKHAISEAINFYYKGQINYDDIWKFAYSYMKEMVGLLQKKYYGLTKYSGATNSGSIHITTKDLESFNGFDYLDEKWKKLEKYYMEDKHLPPDAVSLLQKKFNGLWVSGYITSQTTEEQIKKMLFNDFSIYQEMIEEANIDENKGWELDKPKKETLRQIADLMLQGLIKTATTMEKENEEWGKQIERKSHATLVGADENDAKKEKIEQENCMVEKHRKRKQKETMQELVVKNNETLEKLEKMEKDRLAKTSYRKVVEKIVQHEPILVPYTQDDITSADDEKPVGPWAKNVDSTPSWMKGL